VPQHPVGPPALCTRAVLSGHPAGLQGATASGWATCSVYACRPLWPPCRAAGCQRPSWHAGSASGARCQWGKVQAVPVGQGASGARCRQCQWGKVQAFGFPCPSLQLANMWAVQTQSAQPPLMTPFPPTCPNSLLLSNPSPASLQHTTHKTQHTICPASPQHATHTQLTTHNMSCIPTTCNTHTQLTTHNMSCIPTTCNTQHTTHDLQHTTCPASPQHTTHNTKHTTHNMSCIPTTHNTQLTTHNMSCIPTTCNTQHTTHNTQHVLHPHNMHAPLCLSMLATARRYFLRNDAAYSALLAAKKKRMDKFLHGGAPRELCRLGSPRMHE